jgi:hypothetical protein
VKLCKLEISAAAVFGNRRESNERVGEGVAAGSLL